MPRVMRRSRTSGVQPTASRMLSRGSWFDRAGMAQATAEAAGESRMAGEQVLRQVLPLLARQVVGGHRRVGRLEIRGQAVARVAPAQPREGPRYHSLQGP